MNVDDVLRLLERPGDDLVVIVSYETAVECMLEAMSKYCPTVKLGEIEADEWQGLFDAYTDIIMQCKSGPYAQERLALLDTITMLQRHGLSNGDLGKLKQSQHTAKEKTKSDPYNLCQQIEMFAMSITKDIRDELKTYKRLREKRNTADEIAAKGYDPHTTAQYRLESLDDDIEEQRILIVDMVDRLLSLTLPE